MGNLQLIIIVLVVYMVGMVLIGLWGRKNANSFEDFLTAARSGGLMMVCGSFIGSQIGNGVVVGGAEYGANIGIGGIWYGVGGGLSFFLFVLVLSRKIYKMKVLTVSDALNKRYGGRSTGILFALINAFACISIMAGQIVAGKRLFIHFGLSGTLGAVLMCAVVLLYSSLSGQWGVMMTDLIQSIIIFVCTIAVFIVMMMNGSLTLIKESLPAEYWKLIPFDSETFVMLLFPAALYGLVSCSSFQRTISSKDEKTAVLSPVLAGIVCIPYSILPVLIGMYGKALYPDADGATIIFKVLLEAFHPVLGAIMIVALLAAVMSTVDTQLIYITSSLTNDIYRGVINPKASEKQLRRLAPVITLVVGCAVLFMALGTSALLAMMSAAYTFLCAGTLVMFVGGILWKKATRAGAIAASVTGMFFVVLYKYCGVSLPQPSIFPILPSLIVFIVVSLCTQQKHDGQTR